MANTYGDVLADKIEAGRRNMAIRYIYLSGKKKSSYHIIEPGAAGIVTLCKVENGWSHQKPKTETLEPPVGHHLCTMCRIQAIARGIKYA